MSYLVEITETRIAMSFELEPVQVTIDGNVVQLLKLPVPLRFSRKAADLSEVGGGGQSDVYVFNRIELLPFHFDKFADNLCRDVDWLQGQAMGLPLYNARACLMVVAVGRPVLFVDTQGASYARYVARLG